MLQFDQFVLDRGSFRLTADLTVPEEKWVAIVGPSGAGKTSFLMGLAGFIKPTSGRVFWNKTDITDLKPAQRPLTYLFQSHNLFDHLTVWQNVALGIHPGLRLSTEQKEKVQQALKQVHLAGKEQDYPAQLSGGEQQRVAIARSIVRQKPFLLLDEPFTALDPALRAEMADLLQDLRQKWSVTILMVTHAPLEIKDYIDHVLFVNQGQITFFDKIQAFSSAQNKEVKAYLGSML